MRLAERPRLAARAALFRQHRSRTPFMKCQHCGAEVVEDAAFCHACGESLSAAAVPDAVGRPTPGKQAFTNAVARRGDDDDPDDVLWEGSYSKLDMIGYWLGAAAITLGAVIWGFMGGWGGKTWAIVLALVAAMWIALLLRLIYLQLSVRYTLTTQRFIHEHGLLWRRQDRIETIDIDDVTVQGPVQRMLGIGTVRMVSSDQSTPEFLLVGIEDVRKVAGMVDDIRRKERRKRGVHIESV
jgi:membrane protein YdbS with pleckstrin-like domain